MGLKFGFIVFEGWLDNVYVICIRKGKKWVMLDMCYIMFCVKYMYYLVYCYIDV